MSPFDALRQLGLDITDLAILRVDLLLAIEASNERLVKQWKEP